MPKDLCEFQVVELATLVVYIALNALTILAEPSNEFIVVKSEVDNIYKWAV